jgi:hypothetical protein
MEEQIINILVKHIIGCDDGFGGLNRGVMDDSIEDVAKEITIIMAQFIEWKDNNVGAANKNGKYLYWEDHFDLNGLFNYWILNISNK